MTIQIGDKIKNLRANHGITQEHLAQVIGITAQAVSRWESGACYPDIELLPAIADFFGVSTDDLLCVDQSRKDAKISEYIQAAHALQCEGIFDEPVHMLRCALREFPSSFLLQAELACAIGCIDNGVKISQALCDEAIALCRRILDNCTDDSLRLRARSMLCFIYLRQLDDRETARQIAESLPNRRQCREQAMAETLKILPLSSEGNENVISGIGHLLMLFGNRLAYAGNGTLEERIRALVEELKRFAESMQKP